jgi:murein DD-endopeptidase MepM/ murein hydrolase activator NlpD
MAQTTYTIQKGDTLSGIAQKYGTSVSELMKLNPQIKDPNLIYAGASLNLPTTTPTTTPTPPTTTSPYAGQIGTWMLPGKPEAGYSGVWKEGYIPSTITADQLKGETPIDINKIQAPPPQTVTTSTGSIYNKSTGIIDEVAENKKKIEELEAKWAEEKKGLLETKKEYITGRPTIDLVAEKQKLYEQYGIPEYFEKIKALEPEIASLKQKIADEEARFQRGMEAIEEKPMAMPLITGEQAALQRQWAIEKSALAAELGVKTSIAEMYRGNIDLARSLVSDTVEALTYDIQQKRADMDALYDFYGDYISTLDRDVQRQLDNIRADLEKEENNQRQDYLAKLNYITTAAGKGVDLGISIQNIRTMSLEEVAKIYSDKMTTAGTAIDWSQYFSPDQLRQIQRSGIDLNTPEGYKKALELFPTEQQIQEEWDAATENIEANIAAGVLTSMENVAALYEQIKKNTHLSDSDIKSLMAKYGMIQMYGIWSLPTVTPPTGMVEKERKKVWYKPWTWFK